MNEHSESDLLPGFRVRRVRPLGNEQAGPVPHIYALTPIRNFGVALYIQQSRAFNLAYRLGRVNDEERGRLEGRTVAVIGGGVAGLTAAAAVHVLGAKVLLLERGAQLLSSQLGCHHRFLHPRIHEWPMRRSEMASAHLPLLSWSAGTADQVARTILRKFLAMGIEWEKCRNVVKLEPTRKGDEFVVQVVHEAADGSQDERKDEADFAIVASGFSFDGEIAGLPPRPYWRVDALSQPVLRVDGHKRRYRIAIIGNGDGGALDVLRARLQEFDHGPFLDRNLAALDDDELRKQMKLIQDGKSTFEELLENPSAAVTALQDAMKKRLRRDTEVYWYCGDGKPFLYYRFLTWLLRTVDDDYTHVIETNDRAQRVHPLPKGGFEIEFEDRGHKVINRSGPKAPPPFDDVIARYAAGHRGLQQFGFELDRPDLAKMLTIDLEAYDVLSRHKARSPSATSAELSVSTCTPRTEKFENSRRWVCFSIGLKVTGAANNSWVDFILHPEEEDGELIRRVETTDKGVATRSVSTWNDYWVDARLEDGTTVAGGWLSDLIQKADDKKAKADDIKTLRQQAEWLFEKSPPPGRPSPRSRTPTLELERVLSGDIHRPSDD